jgi:hypothetical protein
LRLSSVGSRKIDSDSLIGGIPEKIVLQTG